MMKRYGIATVLGIFCASCIEDGSADRESEEEEVGISQDAQGDVGTSNIKQGGNIVASFWRGRLSSGIETEFWARKSTYSASASRTLEGGGGAVSCSTWRSSVCGWSGATYLRATYTQSSLSCTSPPTAFSPPGGSVSFLASGSYDIDDALGATFGWTYVNAGVEYWAMNHVFATSTGTISTQAPLSPAYSSFNNFVSTVCAMPTPPSTWFTAYYTAQPNFCSVNPC